MPELDGIEEAETTLETPEVEQNDTPKQGEEWDPERAMHTITTLRAKEKDLIKAQRQLKKYQEAEKAAAEAEMSEVEKLSKRTAELELELRTEKINKLRLQVGLKHKLPAELTARLQGTTEEELEADAAVLGAFVRETEKPPSKKQTTSLTNPPNSEKIKQTDDELRAEIFGENINPFDPDWAAAHGGGVIFAGSSED